MPRKTIGAIAVLFSLAILICALSALPSQTTASAERLAQPSDRPPLFGSQTAPAAGGGGGGGGGGSQSTSIPQNTGVPASPTPVLPTRVRFTRTPTAVPTTATPITIIVVVTATPGPLQPTDSPTPVPPTALPTATSSATSIPASPPPIPPTAYPSSAGNSPAGSVSFLEANPWLWLVVAAPFIALALALWWLFRRRFPLYPGWGRPRRGSRRIGRRYARRRSFPF